MRCGCELAPPTALDARRDGGVETSSDGLLSGTALGDVGDMAGEESPPAAAAAALAIAAGSVVIAPGLGGGRLNLLGRLYVNCTFGSGGVPSIADGT